MTYRNLDPGWIQAHQVPTGSLEPVEYLAIDEKIKRSRIPFARKWAGPEIVQVGLTRFGPDIDFAHRCPPLGHLAALFFGG